MRQGYRVFRLDRIQHLEVLSETFEKSEEFDFKGFMKKEYSSSGTPIEVEFQAALPIVQQKIATLYGTLTATNETTLLKDYYDDVESMARYLMGLNIPFVVHQPPELRQALLRLGEQMIQIANMSCAPQSTTR